MKKIAKPLNITDTTLRDAHQSLWATRMLLEDILPIASTIDKAGYNSVEVWGGATFDVCLRYLNEDPWDRLKKIKAKFKKTPLQMLLRGQNLVGYTNYPDDLMEAFIKKAIHGGIEIFRVFDALNDIRNIETAIKIIHKEGGKGQGTICYTKSPIHDIDLYIKLAKNLVNIGVDSISIKDMSGILTPSIAYDLVSVLKSETSVPIQLHCHSSSGMATASYVKAAEAGVDTVDCAAAPLALYTSQPAAETLVAIMRDTDRATNLRFDILHKVSEYFDEISDKRAMNRKKQTFIDVSVIEHQIPGGMVSNLIVQLEQQKALDRFEEVLLEIPKVRKEMGWPPLVTPMSQIVGSQAVFNVISKNRYKIVSNEIKNYIQGYYGKPPGIIDPKIIKKTGFKGKPIVGRPADLLEPVMKKAEAEIKELGLFQKDEDIITYAIFPDIAIKFFKMRSGNKNINMSDESVTSSKPDNISILSQIIKSLSKSGINELLWEEDNSCKISIKRKSTQTVKNVTKEEEKEKPQISSTENTNYQKIVSPMVGVFYYKETDNKPTKGDIFDAGETIGIIEAMRVKKEIKSDLKFKHIDILVNNEEPVEYGQPLFLVEPI